MNAIGEVDDLLIHHFEAHKTPSVQYILFSQNEIIHCFQGGMADVKEQRKVDDKTTYHAFSVTKTFTALAILQLVEKGKLDLDHPTRQYLPEFPYGPSITVRQLLTHTAGLQNPLPLSWIHEAEVHESFDRNAFFSAIFKKHPKVKSKPNEKYSYSNLGYVLLGQLIEEVSGKSYEQYIKEEILNKLDLSPADLGFTIHMLHRHAKGYQKYWSFSNWLLGLFIDKSRFMDGKEGRWKAFKPFYVNGTPYGGLIGTPAAFVTFLQELLRPDCRLISEGYKRQLFTENYTTNGRATGMCLSWFKGHLNGVPYFAHAGGGGGYYCEIRLYPDLKMGSVIMFNRTGMRDERFLDLLDKKVIWGGF